ncbi:MAG: transcriptional regulator [Lachnobacterium sp.]|nr:transcriptional regulator [Lachnobacterium sp.]MDY2911082.1 transcriptional regulator [Agathobacter sp.]
MPKSPKQKQKLLYIIQMLKNHTDADHAISATRIIENLAAQDISAERKAIYNDIETLIDFGMDIVKVDGRNGGYYLADRDFELAEVKLLVDLVQSSKFITTKKSRELIKKLEKLVTREEAVTLQRQVVVSDRNKAVNENIYYSVDIIYEAMASNLTVRFKYFEWDVNKNMVPRKNGAVYEVSPWLLTWDDQKYYLIAYDGEAEKIKYYRVDKMLQIEAGGKSREGRKEFEKIDVAALSKKTFGMFAGQERTVQLLCEEALTGVIVDRFGTDVALRQYDEKHVLARANIQVSNQFFGWITGFAGKISIYAPEDLKTQYREYLEDILG